MRLIDADSIRGFAKYIKTNEKFEPYIMIDDLSKLLDEQPTAYSVDEVVEELKEWTFNADINVGDGTIMNHDLIVSKNAIEIVKQGSVSDDVCEWKRDDTFRGMQAYKAGCCNKILDLTVRMALEMNQCPYCGKKIKVV